MQLQINTLGHYPPGVGALNLRFIRTQHTLGRHTLGPAKCFSGFSTSVSILLPNGLLPLLTHTAQHTHAKFRARQKAATTGGDTALFPKAQIPTFAARITLQCKCQDLVVILQISEPTTRTLPIRTSFSKEFFSSSAGNASVQVSREGRSKVV